MRNFRCLIKLFLLALSALSLAPTLAAQSTFNINLDAVRSSVVFIYRHTGDDRFFPAGTGFLMGAHLQKKKDLSVLLLVTARHIAQPKWASCNEEPGTLAIAMNKRDYDPKKDASGVALADVGSEWVFPSDDTADVAVQVLNADAFIKLGVSNVPMGASELPTAAELNNIQAGAQVASAGLLVGASGTKRNSPVFKFGYVSSRMDEPTMVPCTPGGAERAMDEWMIAASLVPGNSGSPIYFVPVGFPGMSVGNQRPFLLGVQSMSFLGSDVAGMTPVNHVVDALGRIGGGALDLGAAAAPSVGTPSAVTSSSSTESKASPSIPQAPSSKK